jgi:hypothetical protein
MVQYSDGGSCGMNLGVQKLVKLYTKNQFNFI